MVYIVLLENDYCDPGYAAYTVIVHIQLLRNYPNTSSPANWNAVDSYKENRTSYEDTARRMLNASKLRF